MKASRRLRFSLRSAILLTLFIAMLVVVVSQFRRIEHLQVEVRQLRANLKSPAATVRGISFIEVGRLKGSDQEYISKVFIAEDGRKRRESLTSKRGLITIFDDFGVQRLVLRPSTKTASLFESDDVVGQGPDLQSWIRRFQQLGDSAEKDLGRRELYGKTAEGFLAKRDSQSYSVWVNYATREPLQIEMDDQRRTKQMYDIQYYDALDEAMFSFDVPEDYTVVERHPKP